ncbi:uncharacterized protein LOC143863630 [Tasmannia lanceolata]|uniref:uncharacterized protein LOC143863630 n=1 Tax=Tasmannia lanceolata TaxID=3420 RepID=UPI00406373AB
MEHSPLAEEQDAVGVPPANDLPENRLQTLISTTNTKTLEETLEFFLEASRTPEGRSNLSSKKEILSSLIRLSQTPSISLENLLSSLKILRNLCAGEILNQTSFVQQKGVEIVSAVLKSADLNPDVVRIGLQLLGNVSMAGFEHGSAVWDKFFPLGFDEICRIRRSEVSDPLCMVLFACCRESNERLEELCGSRRLPIVAEILTTAASVGFREDWLLLLLAKICFKEDYFSRLFLELSLTSLYIDNSGLSCRDALFTMEQAFLLGLLSEILTQRMYDHIDSNDFALSILEILKRASLFVDSVARAQSSPPVRSPTTDILRYSLRILRDICAREGPDAQNKSSSLTMGGSETDLLPVVDSLLSSGLLTLLLGLLSELEPVEVIRKSRAQEQSQGKVCPYKGYRSEIVAVIGNCTFRRKHVQDEIRSQKGILLLLQQCVVDEDNPFLREWGIWAVRNLLEGNVENQQEVVELELQGSVDMPEIARLGLRVEVDEKSKRAKLVNIS